jgi:hypothetical protein
MEQYVRRDDLRLRSVYPSFKTRIFEISKNRFLIYIQNPIKDRVALCKEFDYSIRFVTSPVNLTFDLPKNFVREILTIEDSKIGDSFSGIGWTVNQFYNLLYSKFSFLKSIKIDSVENGDVKVHFPYNMSGLYNSQLTSFLDSMSGDVIKFKAIFDQVEDGHFSAGPDINPVLTILPTRWNSANVEYERHDEAFWFDNIKGIYNGTVSKETILGPRCQKNSCYIKYSGFSNVNIRNGVLMFDHIYVELPCETSVKDFCLKQQVTEDELISLVVQNRITFVTNQPSNRMDYGFLDTIYKMKPEAVLSRRLLSALIIADLVEINKNCLVADECLPVLSPDLFAGLGEDVSKKLYNLATWPRRALRKSFELLTLNSSSRISALGVNNCFSIPDNVPNRDALEFEFVANSEYVHIASALNAFYFPFWTKNYETKTQASLMYNMIKLFKCRNADELEQHNTRMKSCSKGTIFIPNLDILEVKDYPSIQEILRFSETYCTSKNFNTLFDYLDSFAPEERNAKILEYNKSLESLRLKRDKQAKHLDLEFSLLCDVAGFALGKAFDNLAIFGFVGTFAALAKYGGRKFIERNDFLRNKLNEREYLIKPDKPIDKQAVRFLSQVSPVARLKVSSK